MLFDIDFDSSFSLSGKPATKISQLSENH